MGEGDTAEATPGINEVRVVGRLAAPAVVRALPSGDELLVWRVVVPRAAPAPPSAAGRAAATRPVGRRPGASVDTLDCVSRRGDVRRRVGSWEAGDVVEVSGALRRRFWRVPGGAASRCEIEVNRARRLRRAE